MELDFEFTFLQNTLKFYWDFFADKLGVSK